MVTRGRGIRWHLLQVQLVGIVPLGIFAGVMLYLNWHVQEEQRQRSQIETVRLMAAAVDNALDSTVERLSIFARLWSSSSLTEEAIYHQAKEALDANADWSNIVAFDARGRGVFRADAPFGLAVPASLRFDVWRPVFSERRPVISDVLLVSRMHVVAVGVPVVIRGNVEYVLVAGLDLDWYDQLLNQQGQTAGAVSGLFDRNFKFVARSSEGDLRRGSDPTPELIADMRVRPEGINRYVNLNGTDVYTAWTFTRHGWGVGFGTPSAPVDSAFWNNLLLLGLLLASALGAGVLYALAKARPIAASLEALEDQAEHFSRGGRITDLPDSRVEEVNRALMALEKASRLLQATMQQRDRSLETEREARAIAEAANRAKDEFLAMLGHELRNPLAAITNAISIVRSPGRSESQLEFATGVIDRQSRQLKRLIDDLLDVGRVMNGKILLDRQPVELAACAAHVTATLRTAGRLTEHRVELDTVPVWVQADQTRMEQVLTNLLVNAAHHTMPGGLIEVSVRREGDDALVVVSDEGQGILPENLPRVFDLFFQGESTSDRSSGGLGIGLTLVQRIVRLHGGEVHAESGGPGQGARFTVRLTATEAPEIERPAVPAGPSRRVAGNAVLVVEDNADARESLAVALELEGFRVFRVTNGPDAIELVRRERIELAVLDIGLPGMDGYELARRLRDEFDHGLVLVAVTGYGAARDEARSAAAGFDRHLTKPVDVTELTEALEVTDATCGARNRLP